MAEQDTQSLEVLFGQFRKNADVDPVLDKTIGVLGQAERRQPLRDGGHYLDPRRIPPTLYPKQKAIAASIFVRRPGEAGAKINLAGISQVFYSRTREGLTSQGAVSARCFAPVATQWPFLRVRREGIDDRRVILRGALLVPIDR